MDPTRYQYAVIGGDLRQICLAKELAAKGAFVCCFALCQPIESASSNNLFLAASLEEAISRSQSVICPIPLAKDNTHLNQSKKKSNIPLKHLFCLLKPGQRFFAGNIPKPFRIQAMENGIYAVDLMEDAALSYFNTIATAEGVLSEAIQHSPQNLFHSKCAVLGYGKCGRAITRLLRGLSCFVSVFSIQEEELAQAALVADDALPLAVFVEQCQEYDFIFNTIPAIVLPHDALLNVKPSVTILDIASYPGGVDLNAAKELSIQAIPCPALPGRYAPLSSARAIAASIQKSEAQKGYPSMAKKLGTHE